MLPSSWVITAPDAAVMVILEVVIVLFVGVGEFVSSASFPTAMLVINNRVLIIPTITPQTIGRVLSLFRPVS